MAAQGQASKRLHGRQTSASSPLNPSLLNGGSQYIGHDEAKSSSNLDGGKIHAAIIFERLLLLKKTDQHDGIPPLPLTPRHKRLRKENVFAWPSAPSSTPAVSPTAQCVIFHRLESSQASKRRISDPSAHILSPEAAKKMRIDDEYFLTPLPPISAPRPQVQVSIEHKQLKSLRRSFTHTRCMSEDMASSQVELSRISFV